MEQMQKTIRDLSVDEREEIFGDIAEALEGAARETLAEGNKQFADLSTNMAQAIRVNVDELANEDPDIAEQVLQQAAAVLSQFQATHPYRMISIAIH